MTEQSAGPVPVTKSSEQPSLLAISNVLLRRRRLIVALGLLGAVVGLATGLLTKRVYKSVAIFVPQGSQEAASGLALAASQFGIRLPTSGSAWSPPIYVELMRSRTLLEAIAVDTVVVTEEGGRRVALIDLLDIEGRTPARRLHRAVEAIKKLAKASEDKRLGAVRLTVLTKWPSVSLWLAERLVHGVNQFNVETRMSQATAERQFAELQTHEAERALRDSEDRLQTFLQRNKAIGNSPELAFQRDRLQRDVELRQDVYTALVKNRDEARIREVRDTPVITVLEEPRIPAIGEKRGSVQKAVLGGFVGGLIGALIAFFSQGMAGVRRAPSEEAREFFELVDEATPRFFRRGTR
jgi:uncharacterized protein involved in exopolysaccharide biosynthesis